MKYTGKVAGSMELFKELEENIKTVEADLKDCGDLVKRRFPVGSGRNIWLYIFYFDLMIDRELIEDQIMNRLMLEILEVSPEISEERGNVFETLRDSGMTTADLRESGSFEDIYHAVLSGDTALFVDGYDKAIVISSKKFPNRGVQSVETEVVVKGSKEAFSEVLRFNTALIRRRIRDTKLKILQLKVGRRSGTDVALMYLDDVVRKEILTETRSRIEAIDIDALLDSGYVEQFIEDDWLSPFPQIQSTERPDKAAAAILEGRIVVIVDNSPFVLIVPATLNTFFQASEDYYQRWHIASLVRMLRYAAGVLAVCLPGLYLAVTLYHPSMLPMMLAFKMAGARQTVPFPAVIEILIMEAAFELLREAGVRLPRAVGSTIGIVGGLIIGQSAVEAGLVSPIVVIVVALTGICSFAIPHESLVSGFRVMKYLVTILSAALGLFGFWLAALIILIHLVTLKSFGIPYLFPFVSGDLNAYTDAKDTVFRLPLFKMNTRPIFANPSQAKRIGRVSKLTNHRRSSG